MTTFQLTMLNGMAGNDFALALDEHVRLGLEVLDLKDAIFGRSVDALDATEVREARRLISERGLRVQCLSTSLGHADLSEGEAAYRARHTRQLEDILRVADMLEARVIRILGAVWRPFPGEEPTMTEVLRVHPWVMPVYGELVDRIREAGYMATVENEASDCILASPSDVLLFFEALKRPGAVHFTWDVQNMWQMGFAPTTAACRALLPLMGGLHLKGGRSDGGPALKWASALEEASWPVLDIVSEVIEAKCCPVICLNPSHGLKPPGYDVLEIARRDIAYLRKSFPCIR